MSVCQLLLLLSLLLLLLGGGGGRGGGANREDGDVKAEVIVPRNFKQSRKTDPQLPSVWQHVQFSEKIRP